jgi:hypothetical protein
VIGGRKATDPVQDSRVARAKNILAEPVIYVDPGFFILVGHTLKESELPMIVKKGETLKNKISDALFMVKEFEDSKMVMLEEQNGFSRMWVPEADLGSFFEKIEYQGGNAR